METLNPEGIFIRAPGAAELGLLHDLARASGEVPQWSSSDYEKLLAEHGGRKRISLVVGSAGKIAGFAVAAGASEFDGTALEWELEMILVAPDVRKRRLGQKLLSELMRQVSIAGGRKMLLEVRQSNGAARSLYEKLGFAVRGRRAGYYHFPEEDAIIYEICWGEKE